MHVFFEFLDTFVMIWRKKNLLDKTKWDLCWCGFGNELKLLLLLIMHFWHIVVARKRSTNERSFLHSSSTHHWPLKSPGPTANVIPSQDDEICKKIIHIGLEYYLLPSLSIYIAFYIVPTAVEKISSADQDRRNHSDIFFIKGDKKVCPLNFRYKCYKISVNKHFSCSSWQGHILAYLWLTKEERLFNFS